MDLTGRSLGNYQIIEEVGRGGMAVVYRAFQPSLNRYVALKVLPPQLAFDSQFVERFLREAKAAAGLNHPNIVVVHDVGEENGLYYIVMEFLEGQTLKQLIQQRGALPPDQAARIVEQVASALDYAHQRGFVHRDVKPANIFVGAGDRVTLTDFGIAKAASEAEQLTRTGMLVGTPEYMSPEQAGEGTVDYRSDLYALGVVLYQMATGRVPFRSTTPHATLHAVIYEAPPPPRQHNPSISPGAESVILKSVAKRPEQRFQSGAELSAALRAALKSEPYRAAAAAPSARPTAAPTPAAQPARERSPAVWILVGLAAVVVVVLAGLVFAVVGGGGDKTPTPVHTQVIVVVTSTPGAEDMLPTAADTDVPTQEATEPPTDAPVPPSDTPLPPADTPLPPSDTPPPPTGTSVPPTDTPIPTQPPSPVPPPTSTSPPPCAVDAQGLFAAIWQSYRDRLGCPLYAQPRTIQDAEQLFQNGHMFWRQDNDYAYVVYERGGAAGSFGAYTDRWSEGNPEYSCTASPPPGLVQPKRGFGAVWCELGGPNAAIGWGQEEEAGFGPGYGDPMVQDFERGMIFRDSDGAASRQAYVFFSDWQFVRTGY